MLDQPSSHVHSSQYFHSFLLPSLTQPPSSTPSYQFLCHPSLLSLRVKTLPSLPFLLWQATRLSLSHTLPPSFLWTLTTLCTLSTLPRDMYCLGQMIHTEGCYWLLASSSSLLFSFPSSSFSFRVVDQFCSLLSDFLVQSLLFLSSSSSTSSFQCREALPSTGFCSWRVVPIQLTSNHRKNGKNYTFKAFLIGITQGIRQLIVTMSH